MPIHKEQTRKTTSLLAGLTVAAGLAITTLAGPAAAGPLGTLSGWGERGYASFMGSITQQSDGSITGHFTIVIANPDEPPVVCRYLRFVPTAVRGSSWRFDGYGTCWGQYGEFSAANQFTIVDSGSPGAGVDAIDVNYYGATGVAIPGGLFDGGDFTAAP